MKVCELCVGLGCRGSDCLICAACFGTGLICLGHESAERYEALKVKAREKAARLGWIEEVWEPVDPVRHYPALARKIYRVIGHQQQRKVG